MIYIIPGDPTALARPRISRKSMWDPQKQDKLFFGLQVQKQHGDIPHYSGPLQLDVYFFMKYPDSARARKGRKAGDYHIFTPDLSNLIKYVEDACNTVIFHDDCLISIINAKKIYDSQPRTEFEIVQLKEADGSKKA